MVLYESTQTLPPPVPAEMVALMKQLTKQVLKEKPTNIYEFSAQFFEQLLIERDGSLDKGYGKFRDYRKYCEFVDKTDERMKAAAAVLSTQMRTRRIVAEPGTDSGVTSGSSRAGIEEDVHEQTVSAENLNSNAPIEVCGVGITAASRPGKVVNKKHNLKTTSRADKVSALFDSSAPAVKPKIKPRKLSSKKPADDLKAISEETSTDVADTMGITASRLMAARRIQRTFRRFLQRRQEVQKPQAIMTVDNPKSCEMSSMYTTTKVEDNVNSMASRVLAARSIQRAFRRFLQRRLELIKTQTIVTVDESKTSELSSMKPTDEMYKNTITDVEDNVNSMASRVIAAQSIQRAFRRLLQRRREILKSQTIDDKSKPCESTDDDPIIDDKMNIEGKRLIAAQRIQLAFRNFVRRRQELKPINNVGDLTAVDADMQEIAISRLIAAQRIQREFRRYLLRRHEMLKHERDDLNSMTDTASRQIAAHRIQRAIRRFLQRRRAIKEEQKQKQEELQAACTIQRAFRVFKGNSKLLISEADTLNNTSEHVESAICDDKHVIDTDDMAEKINEKNTEISIDQILHEPINVFNIISIVSNSMQVSSDNASKQDNLGEQSNEYETLNANDHMNMTKDNSVKHVNDIAGELVAIEEPCIQKFVFQQIDDNDGIDSNINTLDSLIDQHIDVAGPGAMDEMKISADYHIENAGAKTNWKTEEAVVEKIVVTNDVPVETCEQINSGDDLSDLTPTISDDPDVSENSNTSTVVECNAPEKNRVETKESYADGFGPLVDKNMSAIADPNRPALLSNRRHTIIATIDEELLSDTISTIHEDLNLNDEPIKDVLATKLKSSLEEFPYELLSSGEQSDSTVVTDDVTICSSTESANTSLLSDEHHGEERSDDLTDVENLDLSAYGEDSLEAMYYSLRKNDIEVDKQLNKQNKSDKNNESKELSTSEEKHTPTDEQAIAENNMTEIIIGKESCITVNEKEDIENHIDNEENNTDSEEKSNIYIEKSTNVEQPIDQSNTDNIVSTIDMILTDASNVAEHLIVSEQETETDYIKNDEPMNTTNVNVTNTDGMSKNTEQVVQDIDNLTRNGFLKSVASLENNQTHEISTIELVSEEFPSSCEDKIEPHDITNKEEMEDTNPIAVAMHKQRKLLDRMHGSTVDDLDQTDISERPDIRHHMWTSSVVSETDSDYNDVDQKPPLLHKDDFNISTAIGHTSATSSTDTSDSRTATTIVSAVTLIQAGARGFLARRRLRRSSNATTNTMSTLPGGESDVNQQPGSFGNAAITASLDAMVERHELLKMDTAARIIQRFYRRRQRQKIVVIERLAEVGQLVPTKRLASDDALNIIGTDELDTLSSISTSALGPNAVEVGDGDDTVDDSVPTRTAENTISVNILPATHTQQQQYDVLGAIKIAANDAQNAPTNQLSIAGGVGSSGGGDSGCGVDVLASNKAVSPIMMMPAISSRRLDSEEAHQQRRMTLQRGDAVQRNSTPDEGLEMECKSPTVASTCKPTTSVGVVLEETAAVPMVDTVVTATLKSNNMRRRQYLGMRQNSMPVQIDCDFLRIIPKHLRKRIKSAETPKNMPNNNEI